jgi:hypothetical protein
MTRASDSLDGIRIQDQCPIRHRLDRAPRCGRPNGDAPAAGGEPVDGCPISTISSRMHEFWAAKDLPILTFADYVNWEGRIVVQRRCCDRYRNAETHDVGKIDADPEVVHLSVKYCRLYDAHCFREAVPSRCVSQTITPRRCCPLDHLASNRISVRSRRSARGPRASAGPAENIPAEPAWVMPAKGVFDVQNRRLAVPVARVFSPASTAGALARAPGR